MQVEIQDDKKMILVWRSTQETDQPIPEDIQAKIEPLRQKKYKLIIMTSGQEDLFENSLYLLKKNRMDKAIKEVEEEYEEEYSR